MWTPQSHQTRGLGRSLSPAALPGAPLPAALPLLPVWPARSPVRRGKLPVPSARLCVLPSPLPRAPTGDAAGPRTGTQVPGEAGPGRGQSPLPGLCGPLGGSGPRRRLRGRLGGAAPPGSPPPQGQPSVSSVTSTDTAGSFETSRGGGRRPDRCSGAAPVPRRSQASASSPRTSPSRGPPVRTALGVLARDVQATSDSAVPWPTSAGCSVTPDPVGAAGLGVGATQDLPSPVSWSQGQDSPPASARGTQSQGRRPGSQVGLPAPASRGGTRPHHRPHRPARPGAPLPRRLGALADALLRRPVGRQGEGQWEEAEGPGRGSRHLIYGRTLSRPQSPPTGPLRPPLIFAPGLLGPPGPRGCSAAASQGAISPSSRGPSTVVGVTGREGSQWLPGTCVRTHAGTSGRSGSPVTEQGTSGPSAAPGCPAGLGTRMQAGLWLWDTYGPL